MENGKLGPRARQKEQLSDDYTDITGLRTRHIRDLLELSTEEVRDELLRI